MSSYTTINETIRECNHLARDPSKSGPMDDEEIMSYLRNFHSLSPNQTPDQLNIRVIYRPACDIGAFVKQHIHDQTPMGDELRDMFSQFYK